MTHCAEISSPERVLWQIAAQRDGIKFSKRGHGYELGYAVTNRGTASPVLRIHTVRTGRVPSGP
jgi:hypothetical protein